MTYDIGGCHTLPKRAGYVGNAAVISLMIQTVMVLSIVAIFKREKLMNFSVLIYYLLVRKNYPFGLYVA